MSIETLKSYLVGLGFSVDQRTYRNFNTVLADAARSVKRETSNIGFDLLKWQIAVTGVFTGISTSIVGMMDKIALADQDYRLFGERMFMTTQNARSMKIALDALGQPLEAIAFDPELHERFIQLQKDQKQLSAGLGGDFESNMRRIRDFDFELRRLRVELQYLAMGTVNEIFKGLFGGNEDVLTRIRSINNYIIDNVPRWSKQFSIYVVPILKDTKDILKSTAELLGILAAEFTNFVGIISNDDSLRTNTFNFDKFARAIGTSVHAIALLLEGLVKLEKHLPLLEVLGTASAGALLGSIVPGVGTATGAAIGGGLGLVGGLIARSHLSASDGSGKSILQAGMSSGLDTYRRLAADVSKRTGIPADIIYAQWAHETGDFTNRGARLLNNLAGIRQGNMYRNFDTLQDFADYYTKLITSKRYTSQGILAAQNTDQFAAALKRGGYFEDTLSNYQKGMRNFEPQYAQGSAGTNISVGDINIMQPNASPEQIKRSVLDAVQIASNKQMQRNLTELTPAWQ